MYIYTIIYQIIYVCPNIYIYIHIHVSYMYTHYEYVVYIYIHTILVYVHRICITIYVNLHNICMYMHRQIRIHDRSMCTCTAYLPISRTVQNPNSSRACLVFWNWEISICTCHVLEIQTYGWVWKRRYTPKMTIISCKGPVAEDAIFLDKTRAVLWHNYKNCIWQKEKQNPKNNKQ